MLSKIENNLMNYLYEECKDKKSILVSAVDLVKILGQTKCSEKELDDVINNLSMDGYFDLVYSDRHGEKVYCISLLEKGKAYKRSIKVQRRNIIFRLCLTVVLAFISFIIGLILKAIF